MFLNVGLSGGSDATAPRTPEILNSLISLTSPPLPPTFAHYQGTAAELLSPDGSTPGDECGGVEWGGVGGGGGLEGGNTGRFHTLTSSSQFSSAYPCSSLLTPTSDGSPPPPGIPLLASPVSSVEATKSALIKEGIKLQITSKLQQSGVGPETLLGEDCLTIKMELTPEDEERRRRRRERNKVAATKCRNKKKEMTEILVSESETVEEMNSRLKGEVERLSSEKERLEKMLSDASHRSNCRHPRPYVPPAFSPPLHAPHTTASPSYASPSYASPSSSSSCCSSSSPCSFSSLLSPSDSKEFITSALPPTSTEAATEGGAVSALASTAASLDYLEPTISLSTASTSKVITSKCKASPRYHPYHLYGPHSTHGSLKQEALVDVKYPSSCSQGSDSIGPSYTDLSNAITSEARENFPAGFDALQTYSATDNNVILDIKSNPFKYPSVSNSSLCASVPQQPLQQQEFLFPEAPVSSSRGEYRRGRTSRYSPYMLGRQCRPQEAGSCSAVEDVAVGASGPHHNPFFPPCTFASP